MSIEGKELSAVEYLKTLELQIAKDVIEMAKKGRVKDSVKLKARLALLNKIAPDMTRHDISITGDSPYEIIMRKIAETEKGE